MGYFGYLLIIIIITLIPQLLVDSAYRRYSQVRIGNGKSGEELVKEMLAENSVTDVNIEKIRGVLTDHYDSRSKCIRLSLANFENPTVASIAVAAHETGHALQDSKGYLFLRLRQTLGPVTIVASKTSWIIIYLGFILFFTPFIWMGIFLLGVVVIFDLVTLPVEINASSRAKQYLLATGGYSDEEIEGVSKMLNAAALTYVAATLAGILQLIRLLSLVRDD